MNCRKILPLALSCLLLTSAFGTQAAKYYKWVDKNGQVHYTQTKPKGEAAKEAGDIKASNISGSTLKVSSEGPHQYCGKMRLPGKTDDPKSVAVGITRNLPNWEKRLARTERSVKSHLANEKRRADKKFSANISTKKYYEKRDSTDERFRKIMRDKAELTCALEWARGYRGQLHEVKKDIKNDLAKARERHQQAVDQGYAACGHNPDEQNSVSSYTTEKRAWRKCMRKYNSRIRSTKNAMRRAEQNLQGVTSNRR